MPDMKRSMRTLRQELGAETWRARAYIRVQILDGLVRRSLADLAVDLQLRAEMRVIARELVAIVDSSRPDPEPEPDAVPVPPKYLFDINPEENSIH